MPVKKSTKDKAKERSEERAKGEVKGGKGKKSGGHWVTVHDKDGDGHHVYIKGPRPAGMKKGHKPWEKAPGRGTPERNDAATQAKILRASGRSYGNGLSKSTNVKGESKTNQKAYQSGLNRATRDKAKAALARKSEVAKNPSVIAAKRNARLAVVSDKRGLGLTNTDAKKLISGKPATDAAIRSKYADRLKAVRAEQVASRTPVASPHPAAKFTASRTPAPVKPSPMEQAAAHRAAKGDVRERALALAGRAQKVQRKARSSQLRAYATGNKELATKRAQKYNVNFRRAENLSIKAGYKTPKPNGQVIDITPKASGSAQRGLPAPTRVIDVTPKTSVMEQAAKHRAGKGDRKQRIEAIKAKANDRYTKYAEKHNAILKQQDSIRAEGKAAGAKLYRVNDQNVLQRQASRESDRALRQGKHVKKVAGIRYARIDARIEKARQAYRSTDGLKSKEAVTIANKAASKDTPKKDREALFQRAEALQREAFASKSSQRLSRAESLKVAALTRKFSDLRAARLAKSRSK
jgi:hypothetical protein